jgi:hypothetical protein
MLHFGEIFDFDFDLLLRHQYLILDYLFDLPNFPERYQRCHTFSYNCKI